MLGAALLGLLSASMGACGAGSGSKGSGPEEPRITSSKFVGELSAEDFQALCDERDGTVEVMAHCGGLASARGFSYDNETLLLSEHTCKGANTCGGWNCITDS